MVTPTYTSTCTRKTLIAPGVFELAFTKPEGFTFKAGQFVLFDVPLIGDAANIQPRAYSLASAPHEPELLFLIKAVPGGRMGDYLTQVLEPGTAISFKGPFGVFTLRPDADVHILLACSGVGAAPYRGMVFDALHQGDERAIDVLLSVRHEEDVFWEELFTSLHQKHPQVRLHVSLTQPQALWKGLTGRVQQVIPQLQTDLSKTLLYACGNPHMTKEVKALAIGPWGMPKERVHVEGYI